VENETINFGVFTTKFVFFVPHGQNPVTKDKVLDFQSTKLFSEENCGDKITVA